MTRRLILLLDILAAALALLVVAVVSVDGFILQVADLRISFRTPDRTLLWLLAVVLVRTMLDRRSLPFGLSRETWARATGPLWDPTDQFRMRVAPGSWRRTTLASLGIAFALAIVLHDQVRHPYSVPDHGDPLFTMWDIGWVLHQLVTDPAHLFDANIFYPERLTLTYGDPTILPALAAAPLLAVGVHPVVVYNILFVSGFWLSGVATYLLVERLTASPRAAFIAGLMYACAFYRFEHYSHLELQMTQWMPLGLLALHLFVSTGRWRHAIGLGLAGVAQLYSSMYYAVYFPVYLVVIGGGLLIVHRPSIRRLAPPLAAAAIGAALVAAPLASAFLAAEPVKGERPVDEIRDYSATPFDYLRANRASAVWGGRLLPWEPERALFPGAAALTLGMIGLAPPFNAVRLVYAAGLLVSLDASFGFNGLTYRYLHRWLAPVRGTRVPARFAAIVGLTLSIFAAFGALRLLRRCRSRPVQYAVFAALTAAVVVDAWPALTLVPVWKAPPPIYEHVKGRAGVVLAELPVTPRPDLGAPFMYFSLWHWAPMVNGYSGFLPPSYRSLAGDLIRFPRDATAEALRRRGVTHVTVNCGLRYAGCDETLTLMRQSADLRLIAETRWEGEPVAIYELIR